MDHDPAPLPVVEDVRPHQLAAWRSFLEAYAVTLDLLERDLKDREGLPLTWYDVLVQLAEAPDGQLRMQDLAEMVLLSKSGVTRLVDRMERDGLVARTRCDDDRRGTFAQLTPEGRQRLRRAAPIHLGGVQDHFAGYLDDDEAATLAALLGRIAEANRGAPGR